MGWGLLSLSCACVCVKLFRPASLRRGESEEKKSSRHRETLRRTVRTATQFAQLDDPHLGTVRTVLRRLRDGGGSPSLMMAPLMESFPPSERGPCDGHLCPRPSVSVSRRVPGAGQGGLARLHWLLR